MANKHYQENRENLRKKVRVRYQNTKKSFEKKHAKIIKIFLKKKMTKGEKRSKKMIKIFLKNKSRNYLSV